MKTDKLMQLVLSKKRKKYLNIFMTNTIVKNGIRKLSLFFWLKTVPRRSTCLCGVRTQTGARRYRYQFEKQS